MTAALSAIIKINPPRSWPAAEKSKFQSLPYDLQIYVTQREGERDATVRRAQNEAALARQALKAIQELKKEANGTVESHAAA